MSVIVTDAGFGPDNWTAGFTALGEAANDVLSVDLGSDADPADLAARLDRLEPEI